MLRKEEGMFSLITSGYYPSSIQKQQSNMLQDIHEF